MAQYEYEYDSLNDNDTSTVTNIKNFLSNAASDLLKAENVTTTKISHEKEVATGMYNSPPANWTPEMW
eukprot:CAMPEP_0113320458 /NCGR_PEP_ID=MMETSP0010_2-20120614/14275_1 /TAXON_ID=216773 ORGANISM="Corethron hystrix, Strain 308" /NCGR_SAMPLE_ID=MMETSP0010_2 /ASSEMBLY_ACC=CAM_ASM_000155 /LENGTH=67 /DNA_ID=CAMNT_0000178277 /DNA_START=220 /DNA_END=420 /DNA_ORIENTATION=+ /assembly_acc=CAM_ASM_000155